MHSMYYYAQKGIFIVKNLKNILFLAFILLYTVGVCIGCMMQISVRNQGNMYEYLESAMSGYDVTALESIKTILWDNLKIFGLLAIGGFFLAGPLVLAGVMLMKGYTAGFAITAVLRFYGMRGIIFCGANLVSAAIVIPAVCWYSCASSTNILKNRHDRKEFLKRFFLLLAAILPILCVDGILKGILSPFLIKFASGT